MDNTDKELGCSFESVRHTFWRQGADVIKGCLHKKSDTL